MRINRCASRLTCLLAVAVAMQPPTARGDVTYTEDDNGLAIIHMNVTPAAEPVPAMKYRLVARDIDLKPGNAAPYYYRAIADTARYFSRVLKEFGEDTYYSWCDTGADCVPLHDLPQDRLRPAVSRFDYVAEDHLSKANRRRDCEWQLDFGEIRGPELVAVRLDDFQTARNVSRTLVLRTRYALAQGRFDDAIDTIRMNYRLGRDVAKVPILVCGLIGIAIDSMTNGTVIELIAEPGSPNLYWALSELPEPPVDLREAARFEIDFGPRMFPFIHHAETTDHSPAEWNRLYTRSFHDLGTLTKGGLATSGDVGASLVATGMALVNYSFAKSQLVAQGMDPDKVEAMAVGQVMAVYTERNYQQFADDFQKLWYVPYWEMGDRFRAVNQRLHKAGSLAGAADREVIPIVDALLPAMDSARSAQVRLQRDLAALRVIEALRMYAANHAGGLPQRLDEITEVPLPLNPATGQPFVYHLDGATAVVELPASDHIPGYYRRFEIKIVQTEVSADDADGHR